MQSLNLRFLDLSHNNLTTLSTEIVFGMPNLRTLNIAHNLFEHLFTGSINSNVSLVHTMDVSGNIIIENTGMIDIIGLIFPHVSKVNLSFTSLNNLENGGFQKLRHLKEIDLRGCSMKYFDKDLFKGLDSLVRIESDNYKICCPQLLPKHLLSSACTAKTDEISSCSDLLRSHFYRVFLFLFATIAVFGKYFISVIRKVLKYIKIYTDNSFIMLSQLSGKCTLSYAYQYLTYNFN